MRPQMNPFGTGSIFGGGPFQSAAICQTADVLMDTATSAMVSYGIVVENLGFVNIFLKIYYR